MHKSVIIKESIPLNNESCFRMRESGELRRPIVVDCMDIVNRNRDCMRLVYVLRFFVLRGHRVLFVLPKNFDKYVDNGWLINDLVRTGRNCGFRFVFVQCDYRYDVARDTLEHRMLTEAFKCSACLVTNCQFRRLLSQGKPEYYVELVKHYLLMPIFEGNSFTIPLEQLTLSQQFNCLQECDRLMNTQPPDPMAVRCLNDLAARLRGGIVPWFDSPLQQSSSLQTDPSSSYQSAPSESNGFVGFGTTSSRPEADMIDFNSSLTSTSPQKPIANSLSQQQSAADIQMQHSVLYAFLEDSDGGE